MRGVARSRSTRAASYVQMRAHSSPLSRALRSITIVLRLHSQPGSESPCLLGSANTHDWHSA